MEIKFNNIKEFAEQRNINKVIYQNMCYNEKRELKEYVYKILNEKKDRKDLIWEYLNEPIDTEYFIYTSIILGSFARRKK